MAEKDDNMEVSETVIFPVSDFLIAPSLSNPRELLSQISSIAKNLQAVLESESPLEDSFTDLYSPEPAYKDLSSALSLSCDETPNVTLSAREVAQPLPSVPKTELPCCTVAADPESLPAGATPDDLRALIRLREFLRTVSSKSLTDLTASFQTFCDHFVAVETERLLLEEECASLRAATSAPRQNDLNQTTVFEMIEKVCANAEDNIEELQTSLKDAKSRAAEFEAKVESLTLELSKQSASNTQLHSKLVETQEQIQAKMTALSDLESKNAALNEQVIIQEKQISSLDSAYEKALENLRAANAELLETKGKNTTLSEQACTLQDRLSDMESELTEVRERLCATDADLSKATVMLQETATSIGLNQNTSIFDLMQALNSWFEGLFQTYGWLRPSEHPADIHHKFDPNVNPYKLLKLQEQKLAESRDFIEDLSVEIGDLKKDRVRLREQVDRLDSMYKRFEKEATDKGHRLQRYQDFFQKLFEPKEAAAFAEMVARKFEKAASLHSSDGSSRTLSNDSVKRESRTDAFQEQMTPVNSQSDRSSSGISSRSMARQLQALDAGDFQRPGTVSLRQHVPFPPSGFKEKENKQDSLTAQPHFSRSSRQALLSINSNQWTADATSPAQQHTVQALKKPAGEVDPKPLWDNKRLKLSDLSSVPSDLTETPLHSARENPPSTSFRGGSWWGSTQTVKRGADSRQTLRPEPASVQTKPSHLQPTLYPSRKEQPGKGSDLTSTQSEDPGCATS